jgi:hypothetical protein
MKQLTPTGMNWFPPRYPIAGEAWTIKNILEYLLGNCGAGWTSFTPEKIKEAEKLIREVIEREKVSKNTNG